MEKQNKKNHQNLKFFWKHKKTTYLKKKLYQKFYQLKILHEKLKKIEKRKNRKIKKTTKIAFFVKKVT